jgi:DNA-binding transcriptional LysR family regulator
MNLKQIQSFVAIFEEGGFSRAAERLHASQPGLSAQIKQLENDLGDSLFERSVEGVTPTPAGQHFYQHALAILRQIQVARQDMGEIRGEISGAIRLGIIPSALRGLTPSLLPRFAADHPQIRITLKEAYSDSLTNWVRTGELDFAVVIEPSGLEGLKTERLTKESMVLISGRAMGLSPWHPISLVGAQPLKLIAPSVGNSLRISLDHRIRSGELPVAGTWLDRVHSQFGLGHDPALHRRQRRSRGPGPVSESHRRAGYSGRLFPYSPSSVAAFFSGAGVCRGNGRRVQTDRRILARQRIAISTA